MKISKFFLLSTLLTLCLTAIALWVQYKWNYPSAPIAFAIGLCYVTTLISYILTFPTLEKKFIYFLYAVLGSMMGRMLIGIITVLLVVVYMKEWKAVYVFSYFFSYFLYTFFEVYGLMLNLRPFSKKED